MEGLQSVLQEAVVDTAKDVVNGVVGDHIVGVLPGCLAVPVVAAVVNSVVVGATPPQVKALALVAPSGMKAAKQVCADRYDKRAKRAREGPQYQRGPLVSVPSRADCYDQLVVCCDWANAKWKKVKGETMPVPLHMPPLGPSRVRLSAVDFSGFALQMRNALPAAVLAGNAALSVGTQRFAAGLMQRLHQSFPPFLRRAARPPQPSGKCAADPDDVKGRARAVEAFVGGLSLGGGCRRPCVGEELHHPDTGEAIGCVRQVSEGDTWRSSNTTFWIDFALAERVDEKPELMWVPREQAAFVETDGLHERSRFPKGSGTMMPADGWARFPHSNCLCCSVTVKRPAGFSDGRLVEQLLVSVGAIRLALAPEGGPQRHAFFGALSRGRPWLRNDQVTRGSSLPTAQEARTWMDRLEDCAGCCVLCDTQPK
jgi:hypothetical protein